jgi:uncharacterized membrane protein YeaQ/YmgE (transglycosylase-associated protein family)
MSIEVSWVLFLLIGFVAGVIGRESRLGPGGNIIVGVLGALLGGNILAWLGLNDYGPLGNLIMAGVGAIVLLSAVRLIK